jgi:hypothetical protein
MSQSVVDIDTPSAKVIIDRLNGALEPYNRITQDPADVANPDSYRIQLQEVSNGEYRTPFFNNGNLDKTASQP